MIKPFQAAVQQFPSCRCKVRFDEGSRITFEQNVVLCGGCRGYKAAPHLCKLCDQPIVGTSIYAMDREWHLNCFKCKVLVVV